jgi:hypothetical protein
MVKPNDTIALILVLHLVLCILIAICLWRLLRAGRSYVESDVSSEAISGSRDAAAFNIRRIRQGINIRPPEGGARLEERGQPVRALYRRDPPVVNIERGRSP